MGDTKLPKAASVVIPILAVLIISIVKFSDRLQKMNLMIPLVVAVFVGVFGFFGFLSVKQWQQSDEEILEIPPEGQAAPSRPAPAFKDRLRSFLSTVGFLVFVLLQQDGHINPGFLIFSGIVLTISLAFFLPALIQKLRGKEGQSRFSNAKLRPEDYAGMVFGLFGVGFCIFFCYIVIANTPWQIAIPFLIPPLIIGSFAARPLVAGLRILFRKEKDPGEKHINKRKADDPWDRPDRKL